MPGTCQKVVKLNKNETKGWVKDRSLSPDLCLLKIFFFSNLIYPSTINVNVQVIVLTGLAFSQRILKLALNISRAAEILQFILGCFEPKLWPNTSC